MPEEFISEAIKPVTATFDTNRMKAGEPGLPREFVWRGQKFRVKDVVRSWRKTGPCIHGSKEMYVRRHFYEIVTDSGEKMKIYFDRQPLKGRVKAARWWLFSISVNSW